MTLKFFVQVSESVIIAIRWKDDLCSIGGYARDVYYLENTITEYFANKIPRPTYTQKNKMRYDLKVNRIDFDTALASMKEHGIVLESTKTLLRIMF